MVKGVGWQVDEKAGVLYRSLTKRLPVIAKGEGVFVYDTEGKRYLDGSSGALVVNIGHGNSRVIDAMMQQAGKITFAHTSQFTSAPAESLALKLAQYAPPGLNRVFFTSGGSEAVESAFKAAFQYHYERGKNKKRKIVSVCPSYHGATLGALSATCREDMRKPYDGGLLEFPKINAPLPENDPNGAWELEEIIRKEGEENIAAFIIEPVGGTSTGALAASLAYFETIRKICDQNNVLLIVDEVMTGAGRTGEFFAINHYGIIPDIIAASKGIGSGYAPLGCIIVNDKIFQTFKNGSGKFYNGFTYQGNPLACAAGLAVLKVLEEENLIQNAKEMGRYLKQKMEGFSKNRDMIKGVGGLGLMLTLELKKTDNTRGVSLGGLLIEKAFNNGLILFGGLPSNDRDFVMIAPPLIIKKNEADLLVDLLEKSFDEMIEKLSVQ